MLLRACLRGARVAPHARARAHAPRAWRGARALSSAPGAGAGPGAVPQTPFGASISVERLAPDGGRGGGAAAAADATAEASVGEPALLTTADAADAADAGVSAGVGGVADTAAVGGDGVAAVGGDAAVAVADGVAAAGDAAAAGGDAVVAAATWSDTLLQPAIMFITSVHDASGLPWWASIGVATLMVRTLLLPVSVYTMRSSSKMSAVQDDLKVMRDEVMAAIRAGDRGLADRKQAEQKAFMRAAGISPANVLLGPLSQFPIFISFFVGIRRIAASNPDLSTGGLAWFVDLSAKDPTFVLPALAGLSLLGMTELGGDTGAKMTKQMKTVMRGMAVMSIPMTSWLPTAVFCYWIPNNIFSTALAGAMRTPAIKNRLGLAVNPADIVGTAAHARKLKAASLAQPAGISPAEAAASYMRKNVVAPPQAVNLGKPVLLKNKPKKRKHGDAGREVA